MHSDSKNSLQAFLLLKRGKEGQVGGARIRLLSKIDELGSISAAARDVGLTYKGAWDAVQALNNISSQALVTAQTGGKSGGAAQVTPAGKALVRVFEGLESHLASYMAQIDNLLGDCKFDIDDFIRSISMRTTARNAYHGMITEVRDGAVNAELILKVSEKIDIVAIVTRESVENLGLTVGKSAVALIKSSFVILAAGHDDLAISARNRIKGIVASVLSGAVNDEITLDLGEGKTLTAIVTHESSEDMKLAVGQPAQALIKASHVILAVD